MTSYHERSVRDLIPPLLAEGYPSIGRVAGLMGIPVRTLQRRLHEAGTRYGDVVDKVRLERACRLLQDPCIPVAEVGVAVGFSDPSNFARCFSRGTGMSPTDYRRRKSRRRNSPTRRPEPARPPRTHTGAK